ncbi:hypothetical protein B5M09_000545 [Aphanomyces astaci]|uniref:U2A'/phosphoprotein 32 family A C-terminal domain-containing protein n=1 Tax=Aphanomyces astaci TaxID=112090 RepID=A0A425DJQ7_APHAT|nr:hypothetical protein B5M09_000545 [Aphanomyces astaci]
MEASRRRKKKRSHAAITMMDVIKANGMRVVEGTKLNLVAKGIDIIGTVVHAIAQSTTCLYLSQNNIASLDGLAQFTHLKVLSLGGNLLARFDAFDKLAPHLASLRTLHLSGNPLCDAPNYRFRLIYVLPMVHILDGADVTAKEREIAPFLVAQDASLRHVVFENHADISKLEWIVLLIQMHKEFYQVVYGIGSPLRYVHRVWHVSHTRLHRCNARMPHLEKMAVDVALLLRLWKQADSTTNSSVDHSLVEGQLQRVVVRAHHHLQQHPLRKAKQLLQKFGSQRLKGLEPPSPPTWEEAYASVISLQQNTIAKLRGLCERNRRDLIDALKSLLIRDPGHRLQQARLDDEQRRHDLALDRELLLREYQGHSGTPHNNNDVCFHPGLPPQQPDPDGDAVATRRQPSNAQGRDSMDGALQRQLELVEKRLADLNMGQDEERRVRREETAALEQKLRDMHYAPHVIIPATTDLPVMDLNATPCNHLPSSPRRCPPLIPSGAPFAPPRLQLSSLSLWRCKLGRLFRAWRLYVQLHHNLHLLHFQRARRHARLMLALWRQYCERQFHVRLFAASRDHNGLVRCFHKWANASRFHAITAFAAGRRARDRLVTVVHGWRRWSRQANRIRLAQARQQHRRDSNTLHGVVAAWRQHTYMRSVRRIHEKQLHRVHAKFTLHIAFQGWRRWLDLHHCRIKLERRVWHAWATATAAHSVVRKQHKRSALTLAFHSFRVAVRKQSARRHVLRRTDHLVTRQALHWVQQCMTRWRVYALQRRKPVGLLRFVRAQQRHGMMSRLWSCWRQQCYQRLEKRVETAEDAATYSEAERTRVVSEMLQLNDTTIQLAEQVATWKDACKEKDDAVRAWQQSCHEMDRAKAALQQQVEALNQRMVEMDQARRDQDRLAQADTTQVLQQLAAAEDSNEGLRRQLRDGHDALLQVQQQLLKEREKLQRHSDDRRKTQHQLDLKHEVGTSLANNVSHEVTALQQSLQAVQQTLAIERAERRDAAARCKDYETRLADTVRAIHEHEADMDSQLRHTHDVALDMERRWKESEVKNAELVKLLQEKNNCVAALTSQVHTHRSVEAHRVSALLEEVQANIQKNTPPPDVDYPRSSPSAVEIDDLNTHTASIHDDIKALQNRIMLRLQQSPVDAAAPLIPSSRISKPQGSAPKGKQRGGKLPTQKPPVSKPKPK